MADMTRLVLLPLAALALAAAGPPKTMAEAEAAIRAASAAFDATQLHKDRAGMDRFLSSDFHFVKGSGKLTGRDEFIEGFTDPKVTFQPFTITNRVFVPMGLTGGIMAAEGTIEGTDDGKPFKEHFRFADTFLWHDGRWQVVYVQVTPLK